MNIKVPPTTFPTKSLGASSFQALNKSTVLPKPQLAGDLAKKYFDVIPKINKINYDISPKAPVEKEAVHKVRNKSSRHAKSHKSNLKVNKKKDTAKQIVQLITSLIGSQSTRSTSCEYPNKYNGYRLHRFFNDRSIATQPIELNSFGRAGELIHNDNSERILGMKELETILTKFLSSINDKSNKNITSVKDLRNMLKKESEKVMNMKGVCQELHDILNEVTDSHVDPNIINSIGQLLLNAVDSDSSNNDSSELDENIVSSDSDPISSETNMYINKSSKNIKETVKKKVDNAMSYTNIPSTPNLISLPQTPRDLEELSKIKNELVEEKQNTKNYIANLKKFYETKQESLIDEYTNIINELQKKLSSATNKEANDHDLSYVLEQKIVDKDAKISEISKDLTNTKYEYELVLNKLKVLENANSISKTDSQALKEQISKEKNRSEHLEAELEKQINNTSSFKLLVQTYIDLTSKNFLALEKQCTEIKGRSLHDNETRKLFNDKILNVANQMNTLSILAFSLKQELDKEHELRIFIEQELDNQREFLEHSEQMVMMSEKKLSEYEKTVTNALNTATKNKIVAEKYRSLWLLLKERIDYIESIFIGFNNDDGSNLMSMLIDKTKNLDSLIKEFYNYERAYDSIAEKLLNISESISIYESTIDEYKNALINLLNNNDSLNAKLKEYEDKVQQLEQDLEAKNAEILSNNNKLAESLIQIKALDEQVNTSKISLIDYEKKLSIKDIIITNNNIKIEELEKSNKSLAQIKEEYDKLLHKYNLAQEQLSDNKKLQEHNNDKHNAEIKEITNKHNRYVEKLNNQINKYKSSNTNLIAELKKYKTIKNNSHNQLVASTDINKQYNNNNGSILLQLKTDNTNNIANDFKQLSKSIHITGNIDIEKAMIEDESSDHNLNYVPHYNIEDTNDDSYSNYYIPLINVYPPSNNESKIKSSLRTHIL